MTTTIETTETTTTLKAETAANGHRVELQRVERSDEWGVYDTCYRVVGYWSEDDTSSRRQAERWFAEELQED